MNDKIQLHEECPDLGHMYDFEAGRYDETRPICYKVEMRTLHPEKVFYLCSRRESAVVKLEIGDCAACKFYPKQDEQKVLLS